MATGPSANELNEAAGGGNVATGPFRRTNLRRPRGRRRPLMRTKRTGEPKRFLTVTKSVRTKRTGEPKRFPTVTKSVRTLRPYKGQRGPRSDVLFSSILSGIWGWSLMDNASFMDSRERGAGPAFGGPLHGRQLSRLNWRSCCRKVSSGAARAAFIFCSGAARAVL